MEPGTQTVTELIDKDAMEPSNQTSMAPVTHTTKKPGTQFYRRILPAGCIEFSSEEGKRLFYESMTSGYMNCYFKLASQFRTQDEPAFCGLSTLVMVLNALSVDPGRVWKGPWRWYHESMLDCCADPEIIREKGITFEQFVCLAECNFLNTVSVRAGEDFSEEEFRTIIQTYCRRDDKFLVVTYSRAVLGQTGDGHFSPIGGYHPGRDCVLVLDTARFKYPPHWVPLTNMVAAMKALDATTGKPRGYVLLSKLEDQCCPLLLFRLSPQLSVILPHGLAIEVEQFIKRWLQWLSSPSEVLTQEDLVETTLQQLLQLAADLVDKGSLLTSQLNVKCPELISPDHLCAAQELIKNLEALTVYQLSSKTIRSLEPESLDHLIKLCKAVGEAECGRGKLKCCEIQRLLSPSHFITILLLSWPYRDMRNTHNVSLQSLVTENLEAASKLLVNEVEALGQQLDTILKLYDRKAQQGLEKKHCVCKCEHDAGSKLVKR